MDPKTGHLVPGKFIITTSALSLARELWRYGEAELAQRALELPPPEVADVGIRAAEMADARDPEQLWPSGPGFSKGALVLAVIELLEGAPRPPRLSRRRPEGQLPEELRASEEELWQTQAPVRAELDRRQR